MAKAGKQVGAVSMAGLKVGNIRFFERSGKVYSRVATTSFMTNDRTMDQMVNRLRFNSARAMWACFKDKLKDSFESVEPGRSAYTTFMKLNHNNGVFLTKDQQAKLYRIATPLHISDGTLRPISLTMNDDKQVVTDIALGEFEITEESTIGDFAGQVCRLNQQIESGDVLHFVSAIQNIGAYDIPYCDVKIADLKLNTQDSRPLLVVASECPLTNKDGFLASAANLPQGCFAFYLSREEGKKTLVSPQMLVSNNDEMIEQFISEEQFNEARKSYGKFQDAYIYSKEFQKPTFE